ncbi:hypothetical protein HF324_20320 [Chitinophaga oryzae]|uniref:Uncharacterized protein n=1 Tax=Chitinophaga oryzae TaxID=2725414 RepID=A0AAE6ZKS8_9BACT|nr:hypothetical protein [Chitinophaga oryzae]QJB33550.1 hypothetical protein HF329_20440 [Chitinophaga oryzae]QJB40072.1 hypothetical protein HF324_20320 [Chitinophaga oryzae]
MKPMLLTIVCVPYFLVTYAQSFWTPAGKDAAAGSYSRRFQQVASAAYHPAGLSCLRTFAAGIYAEQRFLLKEIPFYQAMAAIPVGAGAFGVQLARLGSSAYYRQQVGLSYGIRLGTKVGLGLQGSSLTEVTSGYGSHSGLAVTGGLLWHAGEQWHTGIRISHFRPGTTVYSAGIGFEASSAFLLSAEIGKAGHETAWLSATASYRIAPPLALQWGFATGAPFQHAGITIHWHMLQIMFAAGFHPQLGITPSTTIIWQRDGAE